MGKKFNSFFNIILLSGFLLLSFVVPIKAQSNIVKVGYVPLTNFFENINGETTGYCYEYLQKVSKLNNYKYEYISYDNFSELFDATLNGEIDIIPYFIGGENVEAKLISTDSEIAATYLEIRTNVNNMDSSFIENDYASIDNAYIGIVNSSSAIDVIDNIMTQNKINLNISYYNSYEELGNALKYNEVDLILTPHIRMNNNEKTLIYVEKKGFYLAGLNQTLIDEFNSAIKTINVMYTKFQADIYEKYFNLSQATITLTQSEKDYIKENPVVLIGTTIDRRPNSYWEDGEYKGIVETITTHLFESIGLTPQYVEFNSFAETIQKLKDHEIDMITGVYYDHSFSEPNNFILSEPFMDVYYSIIRQKSNRELRDNYCLNESYIQRNKYIIDFYLDSEVLYSENDLACLKGVSSGKYDFTILNYYTAQDLISKNSLNNLDVSFTPLFTHNVSMGFNQNVDPNLVSIIDKAILSLTNTIIQEAIHSNTNISYGFDLNSFIYANPTLMIGGTILISLFIASIGCYLMILKRRYDNRVYQLIYHDDICDIRNINYFTQEASKLIKNPKKQYAVIAFNIERFKAINENYSREIGNIVLYRVANELKNLAINQEIIARVNADYFVVLCEYTNQDELNKNIDAIKERLNFINVNGINIYLYFYVGIYIIKSSTIEIMNAVDNAELARLKSKELGNHQNVFFTLKLEEQIDQEKFIEANMHIALKNKEFKVYYQPKYDMRNNKMVGAEALVRWKSPIIGMLAPNAFIPYFEKNGFIGQLDFYILEETMIFLHDRIKAGLPIVPISVNQSRIHANDPEYCEKLIKLKNKYEIPDNLIELEITETTIMDLDYTPILTEMVKNQGFKVAMDDFGSGFSSLNVLRSLSFDVLKIDKAFLRESDTSEKSRAIIENVVRMANDLKLEVICEGVEEQKQADFLVSVGCYYAQGYLYAKPMQVMEFVELLDKMELAEELK